MFKIKKLMEREGDKEGEVERDLESSPFSKVRFLTRRKTGEILKPNDIQNCF